VRTKRTIDINFMKCEIYILSTWLVFPDWSWLAW